MTRNIAHVFSGILLATASATVPLARTSPPPTAIPACPSAGDTLSLLQPLDSAYTPARQLAAGFEAGGLHVRCITRSIMTSLAGVSNVAGLQTTRGTVTVFFVPPTEHFRREARWRTGGYEYTYAKDGPHAARMTIRTNARRPSTFLAGVGEYFEMDSDSLADIVARIAHAH